MAVDPWGPDAWFCVHPGFSRNPNDYPPGTHSMSYEFATWLDGWDRGEIGRNEYHSRNFKIAQRKACYPQPLLNDLGVFTDAGKTVLARAQAYMKAIRHYYQSVGVSISDIPTWDKVDEMDKIVVAGLVETKHIVFLRTLYNRQFATLVDTTHLGQEMPNDIPFEFSQHNGVEYMTTSALRNYPHRRKHFEFMVKLGLIELTSLPKTPKQMGRGRAPVGARLTEQGRKFYQDYQSRYDPQEIKRQEMLRMMRGEV